jgi:predicted nucleotidyltransferase
MIASKEELINAIRLHKADLLSLYPIIRLGLFGSWMRNGQNKNSDVDALIELSEPISLFQFIDIQEYLERLVGYKVDLVTINALKPGIKQNIMSEVVFI